MTAVAAANVTPITNKLIDDINERLVKIKRNGLYIDPLTITGLHARVIARSHRDINIKTAGHELGNVTIETRAKGTYVVTCQSFKEASQLAETLAHLVNSRARDAARIRVERSVDWKNNRLAGDPAYEAAKAEREDVFRYFDN